MRERYVIRDLQTIVSKCRLDTDGQHTAALSFSTDGGTLGMLYLPIVEAAFSAVLAYLGTSCL